MGKICQNGMKMKPLADVISAGNLWILTGARGSGKTTLCQRLAAEAKSLNWDVAGVISPAVFDASGKTGIEVVDLRTSESRLFAHRPLGPDGQPSSRPGWTYDQIALAWGNQVLARRSPAIC